MTCNIHHSNHHIQIALHVTEYGDEFIRQVTERGIAEQLKQTNSLKKTIDTAKRRIEQIDNIISQLLRGQGCRGNHRRYFHKAFGKVHSRAEKTERCFESGSKRVGGS